MMNIKFTGLVYAVLFCAGLVIALIIYQKKELIRNSLVILLVAGCIGFFFVGYPSYVKNTIQHHHPLYPLMGDENIKNNITDVLMPANFEGMNRFEKLFTSTFSKSVWSRNPFKSEYEIPFMRLDLSLTGQYTRPDSEMSGFGPFFAEILILSVLSLLIFWKKIEKKYLKALGLLILLLFLSTIINPECWYARYSPQLFFIPITIWGVILIQNSIKRMHLIYISILSLFFIYNLYAIESNNLRDVIVGTERIKKELEELKSYKQPIRVNLNWLSMNERLNEAGIRYIESPLLFEENKHLKKFTDSFSESVYLPDTIGRF